MKTVADVMTRYPVIVDAAMTVSQAIVVMRERGVTSLLVLDAPATEAGTVLGDAYGVLTMRDVATQIVGERLDPDRVLVRDAATWRAITVPSQASLPHAASLMATWGIRRLPVVDEGRLQGLVSETDIFVSVAPGDWAPARTVRKQRALMRAMRAGPSLKVADLMSGPVLTTGPDASVAAAAAKMIAGGVSSLLVRDAGPAPVDTVAPVGIVTKRDVVTRVVAAGLTPDAVTVERIMSAPVRTIEPGASFAECASRMSAEGVRRLVVVEDGAVVGLVSNTDLLAALQGMGWLGPWPRPWPTSYIAADVMEPADSSVAFAASEGVSVSPETSLWEVAARLKETGRRRLAVVQEGQVLGVVSDASVALAMGERGGVE